MLKALWSFLSSALAKFLTNLRRDYELRRDGARQAELESIKREEAKVDAAIAAGDDPDKLHVENDPQDRASRRKSKSM